MDELKETSGGIYTKENVPPEHQAEILSIVRQWPDEDSYPELHW